MANKHWSEDEITRLRQIMTRYTIDKEGCLAASQELGRPYKGVLSKWSEIKPNKRTISDKEELARVLYKNVSKYPGNISQAIRMTASETGKGYSTIQALYYDKKSPYHHSKASTCFMMASNHRMAANAKNYDSSKMPKTTKQRIKILIASMLGIKKEDL